MSQDVLKMVEGLISHEPTKWAKLASDIQWRRLQILLLREILLELREIKTQETRLDRGSD
jgi:hypothetical protein